MNRLNGLVQWSRLKRMFWTECASSHRGLASIPKADVHTYLWMHLALFRACQSPLPAGGRAARNRLLHLLLVAHSSIRLRMLPARGSSRLGR